MRNEKLIKESAISSTMLLLGLPYNKKLIDLEDSDRVADVSVLELEEEPSGEIAEDEA